MLKNRRGRVAWVFDEPNFDVDQITGVQNNHISDLDKLASLAMARYDKSFQTVVKTGDILVGERNFSYGHPHYPPMKAMRHLGIAAVVAESFSPGFWRGEIANGFALVVCLGIVANVKRWDEVEISWSDGCVRNLTTGRTLDMELPARSDLNILEAGGLVSLLKQERCCSSRKIS